MPSGTPAGLAGQVLQAGERPHRSRVHATPWSGSRTQGSTPAQGGHQEAPWLAGSAMLVPRVIPDSDGAG
jgi:hypothetical protein